MPIAISPVLRKGGYVRLRECRFRGMLLQQALFFAGWPRVRSVHNEHESGLDGIRVSWPSMPTDWKDILGYLFHECRNNQLQFPVALARLPAQ